MNKILELRQRRAELWNAAKTFLETHRQNDGLLSDEDNIVYNKMHSDVVKIGMEIQRLEQQAHIDEDIIREAIGSGTPTSDAVNAPAHYVGKIETIDYLRDKLTPAEFTGFCMGNVLKYTSRWRKKDGVQDLKKAMVYLNWAIENEEKHTVTGEQLNIPD